MAGASADAAGNRAAIAALNAELLRAVTVVAGHYGVGKTNFALNLAVDAAARGEAVTLIDLDVVNPYFRSGEYAELLCEHAVELITPIFGGVGSNLDSPSLSGAIAPAIEAAYAGGRRVIIDAGGDDVGATALGRFAAQVSAGDYAFLYVVNRYRNLTQEATEAAALLAEIEEKSHLRATAVVNNSHLHRETRWEDIVDALDFGEEAARLLKLPLAATTVPSSLAEQENVYARSIFAERAVYPVRLYVRTPWETV